MAAPNTRPVHPCYLSIFEGKAGVEYSTWARITEPCCGENATAPPDLVTAHGSTLSIYRVEESTGKMILIHSYPKLAGNVCFLDTLAVDDYQTAPWNPTKKVKRSDALLVGFSGHPRLAIVQVKPDLLLATTLLDLTQAVSENSHGAVTPLEQDLTASLMQRKGQSQATVSIVLGGGVAVVCLQLNYHSQAGGWSASEEPYILPLTTLAQSIENDGNSGGGILGFGGQCGHSRDAANPPNQSISSGFGDILSTTFLPGYSEPTLVILHANPQHGHVWSGRLGREGGGTKYSLILTAVTVTVGHQRSALLWSTEVPADANYVYSVMVDDDAESKPNTTRLTSSAACLVHCVNSVVFVTNTGQVQQCLATNGWVGSTLSATYSYLVESNPWPFPRLAVQLDDAHFTPVDSSTWFVVLRRGEVYLLQFTGGKESDRGQWAFMSLYQTVGSVGEVSQIRCLPLGKISGDAMDGSSYIKEMTALSKSKTEGMSKDGSMLIGLVFVASRMGDSSLLGYALEETSVADAIRTEPGMTEVKKYNTLVPTKEESRDQKKIVSASFFGSIEVDDEYHRILKLEEDALYAPVSDGDTLHVQREPSVVPPSDDEQESEILQVHSKRKRARMSRISVVRSLNVLDSITALGPLGPACLGPLTESPEVEIDPLASVANASPVVGTAGYIFPCGYGSSGGLALLSMPGRDDRCVLAEADCVNANALFSLPNHGIVLVAVPPEYGGSVAMRYGSNGSGVSGKTKSSSDFEVVEIDLSAWCPDENARDFFTNCNLLAVKDLTENSFLVLVASPISEELHSYFLVVLHVGSAGTIKMTAANQIDISPGDFITSVAMQQDENEERVLMICTMRSGGSMLFKINSEGMFDPPHCFSFDFPMDVSEEIEEESFYEDKQIVAVDLFKASKALFDPLPKFQESPPLDPLVEEHSTSSADITLDDEDRELYNRDNKYSQQSQRSNSPVTDDPAPEIEDVWYSAICRQSGELEIYLVSDPTNPVWTGNGCGHGVANMTKKTDSLVRNPKGHKVAAREMRFFFCGPSSHEWDKSFSGPRSLCIVLETNEGDAMVYQANIHSHTVRLSSFDKIPLNDVFRPSQESTKNFSKLRRKRIVSEKDATESPSAFRYNRLFKFQNIQKQYGAFVATARPFWLVSERGKPAALYHRSRHVAPAGARSRPVSGFCSDMLLPSSGKDVGFMTLHERVGRVGSQRLTFFDGMANLNSKHSLIPGGGLFVEKIPFGVTVRRIQFIDDAHVSTGTHPLYAVLVSREYETDQSELNDDGMTDEERQHILEQKESTKIQRQVEADLGGFDAEQEWVEEIERENCFKIDKQLGGAPPIPRRAYALWIVDAANGWQVVDSYELEEDEVGMTMQVMSLSEFKVEPGSTEDVADDDLESKLFITLGTGVVDKDGEDVASKGRVVLFEVKRSKDKTSVPAADLNFLYDKKIHHGPVTTLSCLVSEGKYRLIIGAGADVNIEQWGNDKLTQVGFFRATMQVLDIKLFKNFFILSDAYDSLYFLVWRESDKSLTLLAKDYDPIPVYATGILSRGGSLDFICHDDRQNLQFFQYSPGDPAARGGNKLVCRADFHLGCQTTDMPSHFCRSSLLINSSTPSSTLAALKQQDTFHGKAEDDQRLAVSFGTTSGGYGSVVPLSEPIYWRLTALQSVLVNALESDCALSHRAWRLYRRTPRRGGCQNNDRKKGVIDGDLVMKYADLSKADQEDLASAIGSTVDMILDNLLELRCSTMVI